ncbi:MAG: LysE family transporter [Candidatus Riflebacteria bacterium]|nr:LysE family transporter [Candidatus Riflebacteria bacterium]
MGSLILYSTVAGIAISIPMGPVGVLILAHGMRSGFAAGVAAVWALIAGELGYILLFSFGLSGWLFEVPWVRYPFFLAGGLLMVGLGGKAILGSRFPTTAAPALTPVATLAAGAPASDFAAVPASAPAPVAVPTSAAASPVSGTAPLPTGAGPGALVSAGPISLVAARADPAAPVPEAPPSPGDPPAPSPQPIGRVFGEVFLVTVSNPAVLIVFAGVVASAERALGAAFVRDHHLLVLTFVEVGTLLWFVPLLAVALRWRDAVLVRGQRWLDLGSGLLLVGLGLWVTAGELGRLLA